MKHMYLKLLIFIPCIVSIYILRWLDIVMMNNEMTLLLIYLIPISIAAWFCGIYYGVIIGILCSISWLNIYIYHKDILILDIFTVINSIVRILILLGCAVLLGKLHEALLHEKVLSRIDNLTGLANKKTFLEALYKEIDRSARHERVISMIYMDIDNFKTINDNYGHNMGDKVLQETAKILNSIFRSSDTVARMGGDEFAILLPEINNESAIIAAEKLRVDFHKMSEENKWQISLSIGVGTFSDPQRNSDKIIKFVDDLMYTAKKSGKNRINSGTMGK